MPGLIVSGMNAFYVFLKLAKLWELQGPGGRSRRPGAAGRRPVAMFSLHIDTARTWRGGQNQVLLTVEGLRALGHRAALVAHGEGELRARAAEGLELVPLAPRTEMDLAAAYRLSRVIRRLHPDVLHAHDPHGVAMAALALSMGAPRPAGRRSSRRAGSTST